jgi:hypothetical protein
MLMKKKRTDVLHKTGRNEERFLIKMLTLLLTTSWHIFLSEIDLMILVLILVKRSTIIIPTISTFAKHFKGTLIHETFGKREILIKVCFYVFNMETFYF